MLPINRWWPFESFFDYMQEIYYSFLSGYTYVWVNNSGTWNGYYTKITPENQIKIKNSIWNVRKKDSYYNRYPILFAVVGKSDTETFEENKTQITDKELYLRQDNSDIRAMVNQVMHGDIEYYAVLIGAGAGVLCALYLTGMLEIEKLQQIHAQTTTILNNTRGRP